MPPKKRCIRREVVSTSVKSFNIDEDVIEKIFSYLPVKFVGRIGARSKRFHSSWRFSQYLDFDKDFAEGMTQKDCVNSIVCIMMSHQGSKVCRFRLYSDAKLEYDLLHTWLDILNKKEAEEIDLDFSLGKKERFVFYGHLIHNDTPFKILKLTHCKVKLPFNEISCWSNLTSITLRRVLLDNNLSVIVNANCYALEKLILIQCRGIGKLKINAPDHKRLKMLTVARCFQIHEMKIVVPTLTTFHYRGNARDVDHSIDSASMLQDVVLDLISPKIYPSILNFEMDLSRVETLTVSSHFIEAQKRPPIIITHVKEVQILMKERSFCNLNDIADFLISCPLLERLFIDINGFFFSDGRYWQRHDSQRFKSFSAKFINLKSVKVIGYKYDDLVNLLVKLFLMKSPQLQSMVLITAKSRSEKVEMKDIEICLPNFMSCLRSPNAKVQIYLHPKDGSALHAAHSEQLSSY